MKSLLLVPHADDETLFASHIVMKHHPDIALAYLPMPKSEQAIRLIEFQFAVRELDGRDVYLWLGGYEGHPIDLEPKLEELRGQYDHVYAPYPMSAGHTEHNLVGYTAAILWPPGSRTFYHTYTRMEGRVHRDNAFVLEPDMVLRKLRALACYKSQIEHPARRPWFNELLEMREWWTDELA